MDMFSSPSWDVDAASDNLNRQLFGSTSSTISASNKKSRNASKKFAKAEKHRSYEQLENPSLTKQSPNLSNARNELLIELKGKLAKKRKNIESININLELQPKSNKRKKVHFKVDADDNMIVESSAPTAFAKKSKKTRPKKVLKAHNAKSTETDIPNNKFSMLFSKISKKITKIGVDDSSDMDMKVIAVKDYLALKKNKLKKDTSFVFAPPEEEKMSIVTLKSKTNLKNANSAFIQDIKHFVPLKRNQQLNINKVSYLPINGDLVHPKVHKGLNICKPVQSVGKTVSNKPNVTLTQDLTEKSAVSKIIDSKTRNRRQPGSLRERMMRKLQASRFRYLNEQMYSSNGKEALEYFRSDPEAFQAYHRGYRQQVEQWPLNPINKIINSLKKKSPSLVIADFGCGDALLARSIPNTVHSFDLVATCKEVTACNMAHTPLGNDSVDVAIFCLSLMGTNLADYLVEANRVLKVGGALKIAEVESRFGNIDDFTKGLQRYGFAVTNTDLSNNLFYFIDAQKVNNMNKKKSSLPVITLKPCLYKRR